MSYMDRRLLKINLFVICLFCAFYTQAQNTGGTEFWLTFGKNSTHSNSDTLDLQVRIVGGTHPTTGVIHFTNLGTSTDASVEFNIAAQQVFTYNLNKIQKKAVYDTITGKTNHSIHIISNETVTVYALNQCVATTDATNILPVSTLGDEYFQISYIPRNASNVERFDAYAVIGTQNNTHLYHNGDYVTTLNTGEVYYKTSHTDMTGAHITADNLVAFFALNQGAYIPFECKGYLDCLMQQLAPVHTWGKKFFVPVSHCKRDIVRIVASQDQTNITQIGGRLLYPEGGQTNLSNLQAGQFVELEVSLENNGCYIQANKPVGVCTYLTGSLYNNSDENRDSDPAQCWLPSVEQTVTDALISPFIPTGETKLKTHYALILTPTNTKNNTRVTIGDGAAIELSGSWNDNSAANMSFYRLPMSDSTASYYFTNEAGLIILCYGVGPDESYYYLAYSDMRNLDAAFYANDIYYQNLPSHLFCVNDIEFSAEVNITNTEIESLQWYIDGVEEISAQDSLIWHKYFSANEYHIKMVLHSIDKDTITLESILHIGAHISTFPSPPEGGSTIGDGCYKVGDQINVSAMPNLDYVFVNWTEDDTIVSTNTSYSFTATKDRVLTAHFELKPLDTYEIIVLANPPEGGVVTGGGIYNYNDPVTVKAMPNAEYQFINWTENNTPVYPDTSYAFIVTENRTLVANFKKLDVDTLNFDTYAVIMCDRVILLNLKKLAEDGYEVIGCKWYKNGIEVKETYATTECSYTEGSDKLLEAAPTYYMYCILTKNHGELCSTEKIIIKHDKVLGCKDVENIDKLLAYPNPLFSGGLLTLKGIVKGSPIYVYNFLGSCVFSTIATENIMPITLDLPQGIYLIRNADQIFKIAIVK